MPWPCFALSNALLFAVVLALLARLCRIEKLLFFDLQTGLRAGRLFEKDAALLCRTATSIAVFMIDLDDFRAFNAEGYHKGDRALSTAASALQSCIRRSTDFLYRKHDAGDEFLILLSVRNPDEAHTFAERFHLALFAAHVPGSIGYVYSKPDSEQTPADERRTANRLLDSAEKHLKEAKKRGKNQVCPALPEPPSSP